MHGRIRGTVIFLAFFLKLFLVTTFFRIKNMNTYIISKDLGNNLGEISPSTRTIQNKKKSEKEPDCIVKNVNLHNKTYEIKKESVKDPHVDACPFKQPIEAGMKNGGYNYSDLRHAHKHFAFDPGFGDALIHFLGSKSLVDIGAGVDQLGYFLQQRNATVDWTGFDGGWNIEFLWGKKVDIKQQQTIVIPRVCYMDASQPLGPLGRVFDWVISLEVGEHIPSQFESTFLDNLVSLCKEGVILSWAVEGQGGFYHVNNRNNDYVIAEMATRRMVYDEPQSHAFRAAVNQTNYLRNT